MPRKKLTDKIVEKVNNELEEDEKGVFIVVYDFKGRSYNPKEFYQALTRLKDEGYFMDRIQKSVYLVDSLKTAMIISELGKHYGAEVKCYKVEKEVF